MASADVAALIQPGSVLLVWCRFCKPPKPKFLVVVATQPFALGFLINSSPTEYQRRHAHLMSDQVPVAAADYPGFLAHDSWVDCSTAIEEYEMDELVATVAADPARKLLGSLTNVDKERVRTAVHDSVNIEMSNIKIIVRSLEAKA